MKNKEIEESINRIKSIVDFYKLNDENNYDYSDEVLISMKNLLSYIEQLELDYKEANESITWWTNRFSAVMREKKDLINKIKNLNQQNKIINELKEQLEKDKKELKERYNLVCKISEERKNKWLSLNEENEILFNTLKKYKLECESNGKIIHQLQNNRDKAIELLNELSNLYDDNYTVSDKAKDIINKLKGDSDGNRNV